jgi:hypothetical protein
MNTDWLRSGTVTDWLRSGTVTDWLRPGIVLVSAATLLIMIATGAGAPWRMLFALWFVLVCPGLSLVGVLGLRDRFVELVVVAPLSLAVVTLTSLALFYGGVWTPDVEFGLLLWLCLAGLIWSHPGSRRNVMGEA